MRLAAVTLLVLMLTACYIDPYTHQPDWSDPDWFNIGKEDAISGAAAKRADDFAGESRHVQADRAEYLRGYAQGQKAICTENFVEALGYTGKRFPASCDTAEDTDRLQALWLQGMKAGESTTRLN